MADSQAIAIRDLLVERLELYDPSLDTSTGSALWSQVIAPVFDRLGTDPFDTDIRSFLQDRLTQEFPQYSAQEGDVLVDLLVTPLEVLLEPLKREIEIVRRGQSAANGSMMRMEDAQALASNFFTEWRSGSRALGSVRIYFSAPTYVNILASTRFYTAGGTGFYPTTATLVRPETMLLQRSGTEYYVDVSLVAAEAGVFGNVAAGAITGVEGLTGYTRIANLSGTTGGIDDETQGQLLARTRASLSERSLNTRRGIIARLQQDFPSIVDADVVGYGDPEMGRDVLTGGGQGNIIGSGVSIVVGQYCLMFSMFENRGTFGTAQIAVGDEVELNFWKFLYDVEDTATNQTFFIDSVLFDSRNMIVDMPSVVLFRMDSAPAVTVPTAGTLPGVLPGVFSVVRTAGKLEISDVPGGILSPDTPRGTIEVADGEVHIGGHYDVWLRPVSVTEDTVDLSDVRSESAVVEGTDLVVNGASATYTHLVHRAYGVVISVSSGAFVVGEAVTFSGGASATIGAMTAGSGATRTLYLSELNGVEVAAVETVQGATSAATGTVSSVDAYDWADDGGVSREMLLSIVSGSEEGAYRILRVDGPFLYLALELTTTARDVSFRVLDEVSVNLFDPKTVLVPFGDADGSDLRTTIGSTTLRVGINLQDYGVRAGDSLEILEGYDQGSYVITEFDSALGGYAPVVGNALTATASGLSYYVYRTGPPVQRPLVRVQPGGITLLDPSGQDSGYTVPYAPPVAGRAHRAFSGSSAIAAGLNGFVLMSPGSTWAPSSDYTADITGTSWLAIAGKEFPDLVEDGDFLRAVSDDCLACDGYIAVISVYDDGSMFLDSTLPSVVQTFLQDMKDWFLGVIDSFNFGGDEAALVNGFSPVKFGPNTEPTLVLLKQFEICLPAALFDGCNNVFVALPEFDWEAEFSESATFEDSIDRYNDGVMVGADPSLLSAESGDIITVLTGGNAGSYVIDRVLQYYLVGSGDIVGGAIDLDDAYKVGLAIIRDVFPVESLYGLAEYFDGTAPVWSPPSSPELPYTITDSGGNTVAGWDFLEETMTWFFQWMTSLGFDLPASVSLDVPATMQAFWEMLFTPYIVGRPTAAQNIRLDFLEPTTCTVYAPVACATYTYTLSSDSPSSVTGETFTLPLADLEGLTVGLWVRRATGDTHLTATLAAVAALDDVQALAAALQGALDAAEEYITITGSTTDPSGTLTITQVVGGGDEFLYVDAKSLTDGFFWLGFRETEPGKWPVMASSGATTGVPYEQITTDSSHSIGVAVTVTLTDLVHLTCDNPGAGPIAWDIGEQVTGSISGASGVLFAMAHDEDGAAVNHLWLTNVSGTFAVPDTATGATSGQAALVKIVDASPTIAGTQISSGDVSVAATFEDVAADLETALEEFLRATFRVGSSSVYDDERWSPTFTTTVSWSDNGDGSGYFEFTIYDSNFTDVIEEWELTNASGASFDSPLFVSTYVGHVSGIPMTSTVAGVVTGDDYTPAATSPTFVLEDNGTAVGTVDFGFDYFSAVAFETAIMSLIDGGSYEDAAQALNADSTYCASSGTRTLEWFYTGASLSVRGMLGGTAAELTSADSGYLGVTAATVAGSVVATNTVAQGATAVASTHQASTSPTPPTLFVGVAGAAELLFTPDAGSDPFSVFPGQDSEGEMTATSLPRDMVVGTGYSGQTTAKLTFTDESYAAPLSQGILAGSDWLHVYEQLTLLEHTVSSSSALLSQDRVVAVATEYGSTVVTLLSPPVSAFDFLSPAVSGETADHRVEEGDLLFLAEGEDVGGYVVLARTATTLTLDTPLTESTVKAYRNGNDGIIAPAATAVFTSATASFTSDDVGRWLTIYATNRTGYDGSYKITAVESDGSGCTLDTDVFAETESDAHWAIVAAPADDPGASLTGGRTALVGLRPIRLYRGTPTTWRIVRVSPSLARTEADVLVSFGESDTGPRTGYKQPYRVVRPGMQRISALAMSSQRESGFYYFDVLAHSLGGDDVYNVPADTRIEPVFGTYVSDGYRFEVADTRYTFSTKEDSLLVFTASFLPDSFEDRPENILKLENRAFRVTYDYAPLVSQVQQMMTSEMDRVLCSNVLVKHFLPSYVTVELSYEGGNTAGTVAAALQDHINNLASTDELDVSKMEKILHANAVTRYSHPVYVWTLTHDLNRQLVAARTHDTLSDDDIPYNGTNRITFFIAGEDYSDNVNNDDEIPPGERMYLGQGVATPTFR